MGNICDEKINLRHITLKNKIVRSATNDHLGNPDGTISDAQIALFEELAKNDVGLIITGHACVSDTGRVDETQSCISDDGFIAGFQKLAARMKKYDSKLIVQINHAGRKANPVYNQGKMSVGPSADEFTNELKKPEIQRIEADFIEAAYRLKQAGIDGVQVHIAHGYLLSQFLSSTINQRTDEYGGAVQNRFRIAGEILQGIKDKCGDDFPVFVKIDSNQQLDDEAYAKDLLYVTKECRALGIEAIEFSGYDFSKLKNETHTPFYLERTVKLRQQVEIPMILVGGIKSLFDMEHALSKGIDMIAICRGLLCEPDLIPKLRQGQEKARCIGCNQCFTIFKTKHKRCVFH